MTDPLPTYVDELRRACTTAALNYEIWWVYRSAETRPVYVDVMNHYPLFFQTSIHAHFVAMLVALYRLYEKRPDTYNVPGLLKLLHTHQAVPASTLEQLHASYNQAKPLWKKVSRLRNDVFGHRSHAQPVEDVFSKTEITRQPA